MCYWPKLKRLALTLGQGFRTILNLYKKKVLSLLNDIPNYSAVIWQSNVSSMEIFCILEMPGVNQYTFQEFILEYA